MRVCIVRHGETDWTKEKRLQGREDIPLNKIGVSQSEKVALFLRNSEWHAVISSPLSRAEETAQIIADKLEITDFRIENNFIERDYGKASGLTPGQRERLFSDGNYEGMEDWNKLQSRVFNALTKHINLCKDKNIIIVSHGAAINSVLATISEHKIGSGKTVLKTACISILKIIDDKPEIEFFNKTAEELLKTNDNKT